MKSKTNITAEIEFDYGDLVSLIGIIGGILDDGTLDEIDELKLEELYNLLRKESKNIENAHKKINEKLR